VIAVGKLFIHGVTREVKIPGTMERKGSNLYLKSKFLLKLSDYNISIPQIVWQNIAEDVEVELNLSFTPL
jgi:polyisoprenoid-binding protein YceI